MRLTVLSDNCSLNDRQLIAEPGLSIFIEEGRTRILFDLGYSDAFMKNAVALGIDILDIDYIALSHGHRDHIWGLIPLIRLYTEMDAIGTPHKKPDLVAHPRAFFPKIVNRILQAGPCLSRDELERYFNLQLSTGPLWLTENTVFLGEIERKYPYGTEKRKKREILTPDGVQPDHLEDDSALACRTAHGLVIVTGCSHAGIINIIEQARRVCGEERIVDVIGGFHLLQPSEEILRTTLDLIRRIQPSSLHACHCTDLPSRIALSQVAPMKETGVGLTLKYP